MKLLVTTVRQFPDEGRKELIELMVREHHRRGDHALAATIAPLAEKKNRIEITHAHPSGEWVTTVYEVVP